MSGKDVWRDWGDVTSNMSRGMKGGFAFERTKVGTKNSISRLDMLLVDGAVTHRINGDVHEFATARAHDDVLNSTGENSGFVLALSVALGIIGDGGNH